MIQYERKKNQWVSTLNYGTHYDNFVAAVRAIKKEDGKISFILFDKEGECKARMDESLLTDVFADGIYVFSMGVSLNKGEKLALVKSVRKAVAGEDAYSPMDCYGGLSEERVQFYKDHIKANIGAVINWDDTHPEQATHYGALLRRYFSQEEVNRLAIRPGSVTDNRWQLNCGRYVGGALAVVANVSTLCIQVGTVAEQYANGLYENAMDYPLLTTASLLCMAGMSDYVDDDMNKTQKGVIRGYHSLLQSRIEPIIKEVGVSQMDGDKLLNTLQCMFPGSGSIKSVTPESSVCRAMLSLYDEMDSCAEFLSEAPSEEEAKSGYRYSKNLGRFFVFPPKEDPKPSVESGVM